MNYLKSWPTMIWNERALIYKGGEKKVLGNLPDEVRKSFVDYCTWIKCVPQYNVWYDPYDKVCFGQDLTWLNASSRESFFISDKKNFLQGQQWGRDFVLSFYGPAFGVDIVENDEIIYRDLPELKKFIDSIILVVGGGPTTISYDWDPKDYDYVWSCNHFFMNEKLKNVDVAFATMTIEVDKTEENEELHEYLKNNSTIICYDDRFVLEDKKDFSISEVYPDRSMYAHTRYRGKIGSAAKLLCMAITMRPKEIHIVGMDGFKESTKLGDDNYHSFQKGKVFQGTHNYNLYMRHYIALWDYFLNDIGKDIKFQNLGEGHESNMCTDISRQMFPLEVKK